MKFQTALVAVAALSLSACNSSDTSAPASEEAASTEEAAAPEVAAADTPAAAPAMGEKPTKDFVVGKWGNDGDCTLAVDLKADGTSDGPFGNWTYSDGVITFADAPEMKVNVTVSEDGKNMDSVNAQGSKHQMTRC